MDSLMVMPFISLPKMLMLTEIRVFLPIVCCGLLKRVSCITLENTTFMWPPSSVNVSFVYQVTLTALSPLLRDPYWSSDKLVPCRPLVHHVVLVS